MTKGEPNIKKRERDMAKRLDYFKALCLLDKSEALDSIWGM